MNLPPFAVVIPRRIQDQQDANFAGIADGQFIKYDAPTGKFVPGTVDFSAYMPKAGGTFTGAILGSAAPNIGNATTGRFGAMHCTSVDVSANIGTVYGSYIGWGTIGTAVGRGFNTTANDGWVYLTSASLAPASDVAGSLGSNTNRWADIYAAAMRPDTLGVAAGVGPIYGKVTIPVGPTLTPNYGTINIGGAPFDGSSSGFFAGNANGTHIAINALSAFTGDFLRFQRAGFDRVQIDQGGNINTTGYVSCGTVTFMGEWAGAGGYATFCHYTLRNTANSYAVLQDSGGTTYINSSPGGTTHLRQGNLDAVIIDISRNVLVQTKLGVAGIVAATTPGTVVNKMPIYDENGVLKGYLPIYNAIA